MKLNLQILYDNLSKSLSVSLSGIVKQELFLERPRFLTASSKSLQSGCCYVVRAEKLPQRLPANPGAALVCIGNSPYLPYYREHCGVIRIREELDCYSVFNILTEIYDKFDSWDEGLNEILNSAGSLQEMIDYSSSIFENPLFVLDNSFHYLAHWGYLESDMACWEPPLGAAGEQKDLSLMNFGKFLELHELSTQTRAPMLLKLLDSTTLNVNLFENGEYCGCLSIDYRRSPHMASHDPLASHLARKLELALERYAPALDSGKNAIRQALMDLLEGMQVDWSRRRLLDTSFPSGEHVCIQIRFPHQSSQLPVPYLCKMLEKDFAGSIVFAFGGHIVGFLEAPSAAGEHLQKTLTPLAGSLDFAVGISSSFSDIYKARLYYLQTCAALENGRLFSPGARYYAFQDYALAELIQNAVGSLPTEMYYPEGLLRLFRHDQSSPVSYIETLRTYLDKNMSISRTAESLYINRSTLLERLTRIKRDLDIDLGDADQRLKLQLLLKASWLNQQLQKRAEAADREPL